MSYFEKVISRLESLHGVRRVIADGEFRDSPVSGLRHLGNVPYIEIVEDAIDQTEHTSTEVKRDASATGRVVFFKNLTDIRALRAALLDTFNNNPAMLTRIAVGVVTDFSNRLNTLDFQITYVETIDKGPDPSNFDKFSLLLDGVDEFAKFGDVLDFDIATKLRTFSYWVKPTTLPAAGTALSKIDGSENGWEIQHTGANVRFSYKGGGNTLRVITSSAPLSAGSWSHVVVTVNGATASGVKIYIDGVLQAKTVVLDEGPTAADVSQELHLGGRFSTLFFAPGNFNSVSVWDAELDATEIAEIYNGGKPRDLSTHSRASARLFWARIGDGDTFPTLTDAVGGFDGTVVNGEAGDFVADVP